MDKLLIKASALEEYEDISGNYDENKIIPLIFKAQTLDLEPMISPELYFAMVEDYDEAAEGFTEPRFTALFEGTAFTYARNYSKYFRGLKQMLIHFTYSRVVNEANYQLTRAGVKIKQTEFSEDPVANVTYQKAQKALSQALALREVFLEYIDANRSVYPEYDWSRGKTNQISISKI